MDSEQLTVRVEQLQPVLYTVAGPDPVDLCVLLDEGDERGPLHLDRLPRAVVQRDHEVEEVGLAQVRRRLLLEVRATDAGGDAKRKQD